MVTSFLFSSSLLDPKIQLNLNLIFQTSTVVYFIILETSYIFFISFKVKSWKTDMQQRLEMDTCHVKIGSFCSIFLLSEFFSLLWCIIITIWSFISMKHKKSKYEKMKHKPEVPLIRTTTFITLFIFFTILFYFFILITPFCVNKLQVARSVGSIGMLYREDIFL